MKDNKKHKKAEYGILITGLIILLAAACIIALCAGQYSVSVPEVIKILASRFVNVTKTWSNTAEGVVFTLRLPRIIGAVLVGSALSLSGAAYQGVFKNPLVAPDLLGVSSGACVGASVAILLHLNSFGVQAMAFVAGILAPDKKYKYDNVGIVRNYCQRNHGFCNGNHQICCRSGDRTAVYYLLAVGQPDKGIAERFVYCRTGDCCSISDYFSPQMED